MNRSDSSISTVIATSSLDISNEYPYLVLIVCSGASLAVGAGGGGDGADISYMKISALFKYSLDFSHSRHQETIPL